MGRGKAHATLDRIEAERAILAEIQPASVRAVCYQMFVRGLSESRGHGRARGVPWFP